MKFVPKPLVETADNSRGRPNTRSRLKGFLSALILLGFAYLVLGWLGMLLAATIPDRWEESVFSSAGSSLKTVSATDDPRSVRAGRILDRLTDGETLRALPYRVVLVDLDEPNAFALPGGTIGLTAGLLEKVESEEGLAFVLAHELGHHQGRHILKGMGRQLLLRLALSVLFDSGSLRGMNAATSVAEGGFSRARERDADDFALDLVMRKFGASPGILEFFRRILEEKSDPAWQRFLGTHPLTEDRLAELERRLEVLEPAAQSR